VAHAGSNHWIAKMHELPQIIPDVKMLLALTPEELGSKILFLLRHTKQRCSISSWQRAERTLEWLLSTSVSA